MGCAHGELGDEAVIAAPGSFRLRRVRAGAYVAAGKHFTFRILRERSAHWSLVQRRGGAPTFQCFAPTLREALDLMPPLCGQQAIELPATTEESRD